MMDRRQTTPIRLLALVGSIALAVAGQSCVECRPRETSGSANGQLGEDNSVSAVIPSPNQDFGDESATPLALQELVRRSSATGVERGQLQLQLQPQQAASNLVAASTPIYASPFARSERVARAAVQPIAAPALAPIQIPMPMPIPIPLAASAFERRESSHAQANFAPRPSLAAFEPKDLKAAASYGK